MSPVEDSYAAFRTVAGMFRPGRWMGWLVVSFCLLSPGRAVGQTNGSEGNEGPAPPAGYLAVDGRVGAPKYIDPRPYFYPTIGARIERSEWMLDADSNLPIFVLDVAVCVYAYLIHNQFFPESEGRALPNFCFGLQKLFNPHLPRRRDGQEAHVITGHTSLARVESRYALFDLGSATVGAGGRLAADLLYLDRFSPGLSSLMTSVGPSLGIRGRLARWKWSVATSGGLAWDLGNMEFCLLGDCDRDLRDFDDPHPYVGFAVRSEWSITDRVGLFVRPDLQIRWISTHIPLRKVERTHRIWTGGAKLGVTYQ